MQTEGDNMTRYFTLLQSWVWQLSKGEKQRSCLEVLNGWGIRARSRVAAGSSKFTVFIRVSQWWQAEALIHSTKPTPQTAWAGHIGLQ